VKFKLKGKRMKYIFLALSMVFVAVITGCTSIESTQKFNAVNLGYGNEKAVCQTHVEIPGFTIFGLPIIVGSASGDGKLTYFRYNLTTENVMYLLTKEVKAKGATRLANVQVVKHSIPIIIPGINIESIQASGTGMRDKAAAMRQAATDFDQLGQ
jgi:ABC-type phosphate transport system ATPase subunit